MAACNACNEPGAACNGALGGSATRKGLWAAFPQQPAREYHHSPKLQLDTVFFRQIARD